MDSVETAAGNGADRQRRQVDADQEAEAERKPHGRQRTLLDDVLQRFFDRMGCVLGGIHHGAAALRDVIHRRIDIGAGLPVAAACLLPCGAGEGIERVGDLVGQG